MNDFSLAWRQLRRDFASGEVRILFAALVLAVVAVTAVGFVTDRTERALQQQANRLLGGDALVRSDTPIGDEVRTLAASMRLQRAETVELNSMIRIGDGAHAALKLGDLKALGAGFPLRGQFHLLDADGRERSTNRPPAPGTAWLSQNGAEQLGAKVGDVVHLGTATFTLAGIVTLEPDAATDLFNIAPRVFLALDDLPRTGLVQEGSRVAYRWVVAGDANAVDAFVAAAKPQLARGQRIETIRDARPEVNAALERGGRFLGLSALVSVILAAIAVAMAARRHSARHLPGVAVMRCLGAPQRKLLAVNLGELLLLGIFACALGVAIAFALQWLVGDWLAATLKLDIPGASAWPALRGFGVGLVVLFAFAAPPVFALRKVPALRVLRRDVGNAEPSAWLVAIVALAALAALLWWQAGSAVLASAMLAGIAATLGVLALIAWGLIALLRRARSRLRGSLRYGLANVSRRAGTSIAQVSALGLGLMALLLLTFVRTDLLDRWQLALSADAPNRFIVNVQDAQLPAVRDFIAQQGIASPQLFPMVRGRLVALDGKPVRASDYEGKSGDAVADARARNFAEREFNLSMLDAPSGDNQLVAGKFWKGKPPRPEISVEEKFAKQLGWKLGDVVTFDIAGQSFSAPITSLRRIDWESFKPNFFVVASPGALDGFPASHITAVKVPPPQAAAFTAKLVQRFPNLSVIDIDAVLNQVRATADQVSTVVQVVFWFSLAAGVLVLLAAVGASQDERLLEGAVMRVLGGSRRQLRAAQASEFAAIGLLAGLVAAIAASVLAGVVAVEVFDLPWAFNWKLAVFGSVIGIVVTLLAGLFATRKALDAPPSATLRELQD